MWPEGPVSGGLLKPARVKKSFDGKTADQGALLVESRSAHRL